MQDRCHVTKLNKLYRHPGAAVHMLKYRPCCYNLGLQCRRHEQQMETNICIVLIWWSTLYCVILYLAHIFHLALTYTSTNTGLQLAVEFLINEIHIQITTNKHIFFYYYLSPAQYSLHNIGPWHWCLIICTWHWSCIAPVPVLASPSPRLQPIKSVPWCLRILVWPLATTLSN